MTGRIFTVLTGFNLLVILLFCVLTDCVSARPQPREDPSFNKGDYLLLNLLKQISDSKHEMAEQERELGEEQMEIQAYLARKASKRREEELQEELSDESPEALPVPSAIIDKQSMHNGKRTNYMALCHFKICNMGRKRKQ